MNCVSNQPHCVIMENETANCSQCDEYFYPVEQDCQKYPDNCKEINDDTHECIECNYSYYLHEGKCKDIPDHCTDFDNSTEKCHDCQMYYHLDADGKCVDNPTNCKTIDNSTEDCLECDEYFYPEGKGCHQYPDNCKKINNETHVCIDCNSSYFLDNSSQCQHYPVHCVNVDNSTKKCTGCVNYYHLDNSSVCVKNPDHCININNKTNDCISCDLYYHPDGPICKENLDHCKTINLLDYKPQKCDDCDSGYYKNEWAKCLPFPDNCEVMEKNKCKNCKKYYYLVDNTCKQYPDNCEIFIESNMTCTKCKQYYHLNGNDCVPYPEHCEIMDETFENCTQCFKPFYVHNGKCEIKPFKCSNFSEEQNICYECDHYYYLDNDGKCIPNPAHCDYVNETTKQCMNCTYGYYLIEGKCKDSCTEKEEICEKCIDNYASYDYGKTCTLLDSDLEPKNYELKITALDNADVDVKLGDKGTIYFITDYMDNIKELFDSEDSEGKTEFSTTITDEEGKNYNVKCGIFNKKMYHKVIVVCNLEQKLNIGSHRIKLNDAEFTFKDTYKISIKSETFIKVTQYDSEIPFLYSTPQTVNLNDNQKEYTLKFNFYSYNKENDILYIKEGDNNYKILDNCEVVTDKKKINCKISKDKIESFITSGNCTLNVGTINDKVGSFLFLDYFVTDINIYYEINQKKNVNVNIKKLLSNKATSGGTFAYETEADFEVPNLKTSTFNVEFQYINNKANANCYLKKSAKTKLLLICSFNGQGEIYLGNMNNYIQQDDMHYQYNFIIHPAFNNEKITIIANSASPLYLAYPEELNLTSGDPLTVRFLYDEEKIAPKKIKLNNVSYTDLECKDLIGMIKCIVPLSHFEDKKTDNYYPDQCTDASNDCGTFYGVDPIKITLPELATLKIEKKENIDSMKIGQKGVIYLVTDFIDNDNKLANLKFTGNFDDIDGNNTYTSNCQLWRLEESKNIRILCQLNENLNKENQEIILKQTSFMNNKLGIIVSYRADNLKVKRLDVETSFLYSEKQVLVIKESEDSYSLSFNILHRDNGPLYLYSREYKPLILDSCSNESNKLKCTIKKDKLLDVVSSSEEVFSVGEKYDNDGIYKFKSVLDITIKSEIVKKNIKIKIGQLLTKVVSKNEYIVYDTETEATDIKEITSDYISLTPPNSNGLMNCLFKKNNNQNKLLFLCDAREAGKSKLGAIPSDTYDDINALYNIEIEGSENDDEFNVLNTEGTKIYSVYPLVLNFNDKDEFIIQYEAQYPDNLKGVKLNNDSKTLECETKDGYRQCKVKQSYFSSSGNYHTYHLVDQDMYDLSYELPTINVIFKEEKKDGDGDGDGDSDNTGLIIGLSVAGGVIVLAVVIFLIWHYCRKRDNEDFDSDNNKNKLLTST